MENGHDKLVAKIQYFYDVLKDMQDLKLPQYNNIRKVYEYLFKDFLYIDDEK